MEMQFVRVCSIEGVSAWKVLMRPVCEPEGALPAASSGEIDPRV
jgi:hypothetical protein